MKNYKRSDLASEAAEALEYTEGTRIDSRQQGDYAIEKIKIETAAAAERLGKKCGTYVTVTTPEIWRLDDREIDVISNIIADELGVMIVSALQGKNLSTDTSVLIVGLGNSMITADAVGPLTVEGIDVTRHIKMLDSSLFMELGTCDISAIAPGVLGKTGIESAETVRSICRQINPDLVIAIDALAAGSVERLARTVQFSDTGINPGAGIGNLRDELSLEALGVPVIAIGTPTVMDSSAVVYDTLCRAGVENDIPDALIEHLDRSERFYVTPKESDLMTEKISRLISLAITKALVINSEVTSYN